MQMHIVKCDPQYFQAIIDGRKTFEFRLNDRGYEEGDVICIEEYDRSDRVYSGRRAYLDIIYLIDYSNFHEIPFGYCIMSVKLRNQ